MPPETASFACHRGVMPILWAFAALAGTELVVGHFLLALLWPKIAVFVTLVTAAFVMWLIWWILSWKRCPHQLSGDQLIFHMGSLKSVKIRLEQVAHISRNVTGDLLKLGGTRNLVPLAFPNRLIVLNAPLGDRRRTSSLAIRVDETSEFDQKLSASGVKFVD